MYEIGRAPENTLHPDHVLTQHLARGFWASLPYLDRGLIAEMLRRGGQGQHGAQAEAFAAAAGTEPFGASLGRIACGYDGGQIVEE
jgi:hypothetical protein